MENINQPRGWLKALFWSTIGFIWSSAVLPWLLVIVGPAMTGWLAYVEGKSFSEIAIYVQVAFALTASGCAGLALAVYYADVQMARRRVKDKLVFHSVRVGKNIRGPGHFLGFALLNSSEFPIEFQIKTLRSRICSTVPERANFLVDKLLVSPGGVGYFDDHIIDTSAARGTVDGLLEFEVDYGRPGALKHSLRQKKAVTLIFDEAGNISGSAVYEAN